MKQYVCDYPVTKDNSLDTHPENIECYQLLFSLDHQGSKRWIEINSYDEDGNVKKFEDTFNVECRWESVGYGSGVHLAYRIYEKGPSA